MLRNPAVDDVMNVVTVASGMRAGAGRRHGGDPGRKNDEGSTEQPAGAVNKHLSIPFSR